MSERLDRAIAHRRALHRIPELTFELKETQAYVLEALKHTSAQVTELAPAGVLAYFDAGSSETIALRTDMDALPMTENTGLEFASCHPGKMHACGHDAHMAMMLTVAEELSRSELARNVLLIFQPAEETGGGALSVIRSGALEKYNVSSIFACHVEPSLATGVISSKPGPVMAMSNEVHLTVKGKSSHIAHPENGIDALRAGVMLYDRIVEEIGEKFAGRQFLFNFGSFHSGTANNIISNETRFAGALRSYDENLSGAIKQTVIDMCAEIAQKTQTEIQAYIPEVCLPLLNDESCFERLKRLADGMRFQLLPKPFYVSEDFAYYLKKVPGCMFYLGIGSETPLHSTNFFINEEALESGVEMFMRLALN